MAVELPPSHDGPPENLHERKLPIFQMDGYSIMEWHEQLDGKGKPSQVHLVLETANSLGCDLGLRIKSRKACETLIAGLTRHMNSVWPEKK